MMSRARPSSRPAPLAALRAAAARARARWLDLTADEQRAAALVLALFLLGVAVRWWRQTRGV